MLILSHYCYEGTTQDDAYRPLVTEIRHLLGESRQTTHEIAALLTAKN